MMNRLALARDMIGLAATSGVETAVHGVAAVCDPLGALYLPDAGMLVVSDLHLEKGAAFARRGMMLPPYDTLATLTVLAAVISRYDPKLVISLGDNFHDRIGSQHLPENFRALIVAMARGREWIWINGNHDPDGIVDLPGTSADEIALCRPDLPSRAEARAAEGRNRRPPASVGDRASPRKIRPPPVLRHRRRPPADAGLRRDERRPRPSP